VEADVGGLLSTTRERVAQVLETTESAASEILEAANLEAERVVAEAQRRAETLVGERMERISKLTESVMAKAGTLDRELDVLRETLNASLTELAQDLGVERPGRPVAPRGGDGVQARPIPDRERESALQILATELLSAGESVEGASRRMVEEFGVQSPQYVFDSLGIEVVTTHE
jgi:hypothetical protein